MYDLIIIGGGPAGITAGIYAARKKLQTLVLSGDFFGQIAKSSRVDNWPGEPEVSGMVLMGKLEKHLRSFEVETKTGQKVTAVKEGGNLLPAGRRFPPSSFIVQTEANEEFSARTVIVATGRNPRALGIDGEKELVGRGVSYCAVCDAPFFKDKTVAVAGGGNAGLGTVFELLAFAKKILLFEKAQTLPADEILQERVKKESRVEIILRSELQKIEGKNMVEAVVYKNLANNEVARREVSGVFVQVDSIPASGFLAGLVDFNETGEIKINPFSCQTSLPGIFAAGDVTEGKYKQAIIAAGEGAKAALAAYEYLQKK
ncbi:MAG: FAD-dependent oxidoreductase [Patescibacteria group bacterium]|nr:FAD-dependent oxidoreductase [Patescibacteria group bacterium]